MITCQKAILVLKSWFWSKKLILVHFRRENTVDQNRLLGATPTRDLNSFKHFSGPKNKTLRNIVYWEFFDRIFIPGGARCWVFIRIFVTYWDHLRYCLLSSAREITVVPTKCPKKPEDLRSTRKSTKFLTMPIRSTQRFRMETTFSIIKKNGSQFKNNGLQSKFKIFSTRILSIESRNQTVKKLWHCPFEPM